MNRCYPLGYFRLFVSALMLATLTACAPPPTPTPVSFSAGVEEIESVNLSSASSTIEWSPTGERVAVIEGLGVVADGGFSPISLKVFSSDFATVEFDQKIDSHDISWSSDGQRLLYLWSTGSDNYAIRLLDLPSMGTRQIMESNRLCQASFIPHSELILVRSCEPPGLTPTVRFINLSGKTEDRIRLPSYIRDVMKIVISPEGKQMLILTNPEDLYSLYVSDLRSNEMSALISNSSNYLNYPTWSPDEKLVAYTQGIASRTELVVQDVMGVCPVSKLALAGIVSDLNWHPDGQRLFVIFSADRFYLLSIDVAKVFGETLQCVSTKDS